MSKDSFWFRHDTTAGRGLRLRKIQHIYTHWGKGIYWDVIEILREQQGYFHPSDEGSLQLLSSLIGCQEPQKFLNWFKDCVRLDLLQEKDGVFFSSVLNENMRKWEIKKRNPSGSGSETLTNPLTDDEYKRREEKMREHKNTFEVFRLLYEGRKRGLDTEFEYFCKHKDWEQIIPLLTPAVKSQKTEKDVARAAGKFTPEWKNLKTWILNRCWEDSVSVITQTDKSKLTITPDELRDLYTK